MIPGRLLLAPLQGVTDPILREVLTALGGIDGCVSVYSRVSIRPLPAHALSRTCPEMVRGGVTSAGVFVQPQLLGGDADLLAETARNAARAGATAIDLNFGCPMGRVNRHDGGAALLREPRRITRIVEAVRRAANVPVSAKVRIGWSSATEADDIAKAVEQGGAAWITVHGRTRDQLYEGAADWDAIGRARQSVRIPVVANGDIRDPESLARCEAHTGCEHFMIGRGALARPELFRLLSGIDEDWWPLSKRLALLDQYGSRCAAAGIPDANVVGRVKGWWRYMSEVDEQVWDAFERVRRLTTWVALRQALRSVSAACAIDDGPSKDR